MTRKKSNATKRLSGNPGQRPVPAADVEPTGPLGPPPDHLDVVGRQVWETLGPELVKATGAGNLDRLLFAGLCSAWSHHVHAERSVQRHGRVMEVRDANGVVKSAGPSPDFRVSLQALDVVKRMVTDFGLSPGARATSAIQPPVEIQPEDAWLLEHLTQPTVPMSSRKAAGA
jgi:P27 family predicted phage terminase small subunit